MTKVIEAVYVDTPLALGVGAYAIHDFAGFDPRFIVGVLNSRFMSFFLTTRFKDKHLAGGYLAINKSTIEALPLVAATKAEQHTVALLHDEIVAARMAGFLDEAGRLEKKVDLEVARLYELTDAERDEVGRSMD